MTYLFKYKSNKLKYEYKQINKCCMFLESGQCSPVESGGLHWTPTYLDYSQNLISRGFSPADSGGHTGPPSLDNTQFYIPVDSGGPNM